MISPQRQGMVYTGCLIPLNKVIVFPQVRKTFEIEGLRELAEDIALNGVLQPSIAAKLSKENFIIYMKTFESISNVSLGSVEDYPEIDGYYYCLIAGERRYRAHVILWEEGCEHCRGRASTQQKVLEKGHCYHLHYGDEFIELRTALNIDPLSAKSIQFRENNHVKPPAHEEAEEYQNYFRYLRIDNPHLTFAEFARIVGVSVEKVRKALWFCELPDRVQKAVREKLIFYSHAVEFKKIMDVDPKILEDKKKLSLVHEELDYLIMRPRFTLDAFKERIKGRLDVVISGYGPLFGELAPLTKKEKRKVVGQDLLPLISVLLRYIDTLEDKDKQSILGKGKIYSGGSPNFQMAAIIKGFEKLYKVNLSPAVIKKMKSRNFEESLQSAIVKKVS